jgi:hypothetical protein
MHRLHCIIAAFLLLPVSLLAEPTGTRPDTSKGPNEMEVRLVDGSRIHMIILQENLEIVTKYGTLTVPTRDIRKIEFGVRHVEAVRKRITDAICKLGSVSFKEREGAGTDLLAIGPPAYLSLQQAKKSADREVAHRAEALLEQMRQRFTEDQLRTRPDDLVQTLDFTIAGRVTSPTIRAMTTIFGDAQLKVSDLRSIRLLGGLAEIEVNVDATKYTSTHNWMDTGVLLTPDDEVSVTASGQVDLMINGGGNMVTGPAGSHQWGNGPGGAGHPPGALLGKIGDSGTVFVVGESYKTTCKKEGRLYLQITPGPFGGNGNMVGGSYKVNIIGGRDTAER